METDKNTCWYDPACVNEMNRFYDAPKGDHETTRHFQVFADLIRLTDERGAELLDLGCGTGMLSEYCREFTYIGADLPHIISGAAMRNYPAYYYRKCDIVNDDLSWCGKYKVVSLNAVIDVMEHPMQVLEKILWAASKWVIIHRQEITEQGVTRSEKRDSYSGYTYHSIINRQDFNRLLEENNFDIVRELPLHFTNWENNGSSFLLRKRKSWSLYNIDHKLNAIFKDVPEGFFIEAGANDGLRQSNSFYFEFYKNWRGLLVEPVEELYMECLQNRSPNTIIENCALVSGDHAQPGIDIIYTPKCNGLMSVIEGNNSFSHLAKAGERGIRKTVPACTLNSLLEKHKIGHVDILMLDVEGYEMEAIKGIDFDKHRIDYLLIEELDGHPELGNYLDKWYGRIERLTHHDYLYKRR